jgi:hypothetical protein
MHEHEMLHVWEHDHNYLSSGHSRAERNTWRVIALTAVMMVIEITAGTMLGSMALLVIVHPGWWMSARGGDCGFTLIEASAVATALIVILAAVLSWRARGRS